MTVLPEAKVAIQSGCQLDTDGALRAYWQHRRKPGLGRTGVHSPT